MGGLEKDTIGGYNAMLEKQRAVEGECLITTVLFDDKYELLHDRTDLRAVSPITENEYNVRGSTALLDAVGRTIHKIGNAQRHTADDFRAEKVMFVIITDGEENSSREYSSAMVRTQLKRQRSKYGWEFIFLGANIDTAETADTLGIDRDRAQSYRADGEGVQLNFKAMSKAVSAFRRCGCVPDRWNEDIEEDFAKRG